MQFDTSLLGRRVWYDKEDSEEYHYCGTIVAAEKDDYGGFDLFIEDHTSRSILRRAWNEVKLGEKV